MNILDIFPNEDIVVFPFDNTAQELVDCVNTNIFDAKQMNPIFMKELETKILIEGTDICQIMRTIMQNEICILTETLKNDVSTHKIIFAVRYFQDFCSKLLELPINNDTMKKGIESDMRNFIYVNIIKPYYVIFIEAVLKEKNKNIMYILLSLCHDIINYCEEDAEFMDYINNYISEKISHTDILNDILKKIHIMIIESNDNPAKIKDIKRIIKILNFFRDSDEIQLFYAKYLQTRLLNETHNLALEKELVSMITGIIANDAGKFMSCINDIEGNKFFWTVLKKIHIDRKSERAKKYRHIDSKILHPVIINKNSWTVYNHLKIKMPEELQFCRDIIQKTYIESTVHSKDIDWLDAIGIVDYTVELNKHIINIRCNVLQATVFCYFNEGHQSINSDVLSKYINVEKKLCSHIISSMVHSDLLIQVNKQYIINKNLHYADTKMNLIKKFHNMFECHKHVEESKEIDVSDLESDFFNKIIITNNVIKENDESDDESDDEVVETMNKNINDLSDDESSEDDDESSGQVNKDLEVVSDEDEPPIPIKIATKSVSKEAIKVGMKKVTKSASKKAIKVGVKKVTNSASKEAIKVGTKKVINSASKEVNTLDVHETSDSSEEEIIPVPKKKVAKKVYKDVPKKTVAKKLSKDSNSSDEEDVPKKTVAKKLSKDSNSSDEEDVPKKTVAKKLSKDSNSSDEDDVPKKTHVNKLDKIHDSDKGASSSNLQEINESYLSETINGDEDNSTETLPITMKIKTELPSKHSSSKSSSKFSNNYNLVSNPSN